jgi:antibiotic biosynthesis monooxygenase (ABM) superfamily enzyme
MISVVSHAWLLPSGEIGQDHQDGLGGAGDRPFEDAMRAYSEISEQFDALHREVGGYHGRRLMHSVSNGGHVLNIRWFDRVEDYERLTKHPDYPSWIARLSKLVEARNPEKEYFEMVLDTVVENVPTKDYKTTSTT